MAGDFAIAASFTRADMGALTGARLGVAVSGTPASAARTAP